VLGECFVSEGNVVWCAIVSLINFSVGALVSIGVVLSGLLVETDLVEFVSRVVVGIVCLGLVCDVLCCVLYCMAGKRGRLDMVGFWLSCLVSFGFGFWMSCLV
jgi:hypothetical protein